MGSEGGAAGSPRTSFLLHTAAFLLTAATAAWAQSGTQELKLTVGKSVVIDYPSDIGRISTSNPDVVDAVPITAREVLINAKSFGISTIVVWSKSGERSFFAVTVEANLESMQKLLKDTFPSEPIEVKASRESASLNGRVSSQAVSDRATALVAPLVKSVVNNLQITPPGVEKQIVLRVRFAELNRTKAVQLGANLFSTGAANTPGRVTTGQFGGGNPAELKGIIGGSLPGTSTSFNLSDVLNVFAFRPDLNLAATIRALQTQNVLQILAEPNLLTTNGKEASFLAGGEFPVPVLQGGANAGAVTIQFKEFGIRLNFVPNVTPHNTVKMHIKSELSTIDLANAVTFSGFTIPALAARRSETDIELGEGQSFVVAGLLDDRAQEQLFRMPGLANIPILGNLFKSRSTNRSKTELVVMVTPDIVTPLQPNDLKPATKLYRDGMPPVFNDTVRGAAQHEEALQAVKQAPAAAKEKKK
ncbi:MAG: pilus assembly protein N-terminal domain-containing protein [Acidobacteria bacterium]|nr:pilus assembly protein N-terminal domain-containing protein [Acidobacteriota bacterium]MBI3473274.1 pilus assembly protein N-terminal domain-containing protein [Candidatus Solibacter usitatus]